MKALLTFTKSISISNRGDSSFHSSSSTSRMVFCSSVCAGAVTSFFSSTFLMLGVSSTSVILAGVEGSAGGGSSVTIPDGAVTLDAAMVGDVAIRCE